MSALREIPRDLSDRTAVDVSSSGTITVIVVSAASSLVVLAVGITIGVLLWKQRYIQKKRKGKRFCYTILLPSDEMKRIFCYVP